MLATLAGGELKAAFRDLSSLASKSTDKKARALQEAACAIIHNLYHDDRISKERAKEYLKHCAKPRNPESFLQGLITYHNTRVRRATDIRGADFAFNDPASNGDNFLNDKPRARSYLGTTFNLSRDQLGVPILRISTAIQPNAKVPADWAELERIISQLDTPAQQKIKRALKRINCVDSKDNSECALRIRQTMNDARYDDKKRRQIAHAVFELLALHRRFQHFEPTWAFDWNELQTLVSKGPPGQKLEDLNPESWVESVGNFAVAGDWIALVRYPASKPRRLIRPTQLDAGHHEYHFPAPALESRSGHPVWLAYPCNVTHSHLIKEYIHESVPFALTNIVAVKQVTQTIPSPKGAYGSWRSNHWEVLKNRIGPVVANWMPSIDTI